MNIFGREITKSDLAQACCLLLAVGMGITGMALVFEVESNNKDESLGWNQYSVGWALTASSFIACCCLALVDYHRETQQANYNRQRIMSPPPPEAISLNPTPGRVPAYSPGSYT